MIARIAGKLLDLQDQEALVEPIGSTLAYQVLLPAFLATELAPALGQMLHLHTIEYLENQGNGSSYIPRLVGFQTADQLTFFELLTTVSGVGNRKALRALAVRPDVFARAVHEKDIKFLATLPEIGKRMAERLATELQGKVDAFLAPGSGDRRPLGRIEPKSTAHVLPTQQEDAVRTLVALGQTRHEAEELLVRVIGAHEDAQHLSVQQLVSLVFARAQS
jgi:Holliday junction DNA helicase RuvA